MHGRPRQKGLPDPERVKAAQQKAALYGKLTGEVLARRRGGQADVESLGLAAKLLELNPEVYTVWNWRREALAPVLAAGGEAAVAAAAGELAVTERALHRNPKSYSTWHHRKWVVGHRLSSLERELELVGQLLQADARNFHGWAYRRFVAGLMGTPAERELGYAEKKINQNFSNYSAWHYRTTLLPELYASSTAAEAPASSDAGHAPAASSAASGSEQQLGSEAAPPTTTPSVGAPGAASSSATPPSAARRGAAVPKDALDAEYELVKQAFYTEPEDQSGWFYHRWLLGCSLAHWEAARGGAAEAAERKALLGVVVQEAAMCEELLAVEPDAKWPLLTMVRLRELQQTVTRGGGGSGAGSGSGSSSGGNASSGSTEVEELYARLLEVDPLRRGYYEDAQQGRAKVVAAVLAD
eukprot:scaffold19.g1811.t1